MGVELETQAGLNYSRTSAEAALIIDKHQAKV